MEFSTHFASWKRWPRIVFTDLALAGVIAVPGRWRSGKAAPTREGK